MLKLRQLAGALGAIGVLALAACDVSLPTGPAADPTVAGTPGAGQAVGAAAVPRSWCVAPTGKDNNPGTAALPFLTIQKGVNSAAASDTITGFALRNSGFFGVMIDRSSRVIVRNNNSVTSAGSALHAASSTNVTIADNDFSDFCKLGQNVRGTPCQEGISIVSVDTFDVSGNLVHDARQNGAQVQPGGGEGIDTKEASKHGKIRFNKVWNLVQLGIYVDAWDKTAEDIEIYGNRVWFTTAGIVIASEMGGTVRNVRVHDNLVYRNGDDGISVTNYGKNGLRDGIAIYNNTMASNGYTANKAPYCTLWGCGNYGTGLRVQTTNIRNSRIHDNISYNNATTVMESAASATNLVIDTNLLFPVGKSLWAPEKLGLRPIKLDPKFVFPGPNDYHLQATSPAIRRTIGGDPLNVDADKVPRLVFPSDLGSFLYR